MSPPPTPARDRRGAKQDLRQGHRHLRRGQQRPELHRHRDMLTSQGRPARSCRPRRGTLMRPASTAPPASAAPAKTARAREPMKRPVPASSSRSSATAPTSVSRSRRHAQLARFASFDVTTQVVGQNLRRKGRSACRPRPAREFHQGDIVPLDALPPPLPPFFNLLVIRPGRVRAFKVVPRGLSASTSPRRTRSPREYHGNAGLPRHDPGACRRLRQPRLRADVIILIPLIAPTCGLRRTTQRARWFAPRVRCRQLAVQAPSR